MSSRITAILAVLSLMIFQGQAYAKVSDLEAQRLGQDLTPTGAIRAGNKSGSIPRWNGGITQPMAEYEDGQFHQDPFSKDKIILSIDSSNWQKHQDQLTAGQIAFLKKFPSYKINVYPTHRSAAYPQFVYDALKDNALRAELQEYGTGVRNTMISSPFPIPKNGLEVLWNHTLRFRGLQYQSISTNAINSSSGDTLLVTRDSKYFMAYSQPDVTLEDIDNKIFYVKRKTLSPATKAGEFTLVHETLDQVLSPRKAWQYQPGERRVRRTPNLSYDTSDDNNGIGTIDQFDMYNGAPDFYNWTLIGKQEKYVPYNSYKVHSGELKIDDIVGEEHVNSNLMRYELHRVWIVEAQLRIGMSHVYEKRRFYFDEDTWQIVLAEEYNKQDELIHFSEAHTINYYEVPTVASTLKVNHNLEQDRYYVEGLDNERKPVKFSSNFTARQFTSSALRREAR
jgi:hypothetical protein